MKIKSLFIALCFVSLMGTTYSVKAEKDCQTVVVDCGDGPVTNGQFCWDDPSEAKKAVRELFDAVCNPN
ncbi:hypothetical protein [Marinifilum sp. D737]|uniref:hypothetical protein n=1 Tax=Marinifilum sp. D737 TaxID=2969628 RepID=UPI00227517BA|nr:hypothetical protein [Marinifilum sp. D737]MCY1636756.1 hypothetical protein [Marinifilum sp. D737]